MSPAKTAISPAPRHLGRFEEETEKFFVLSMEFLSLPSRKERGETAVFTGCETCKVFGFNAIKYSLLLLLLQSKKKQ